ncbi:MAG: hypothetical protein N3B12_04815 [Armatimonadetes bacterium]|nr:hypothetical protein [Armatimonadota bacterium]
MTTDTVEREAKLFEAGEYPDRGIEITEEDLDRIVENTRNAPIRIEHMFTPFDGALGFLKLVYRKGKELFGRLCFTRPAWELVNAANAQRLSVALKKDKSGIAEVSLVREPRIADAAVFGEVAFLPGGEVGSEFEAKFAAGSPQPLFDNGESLCSPMLTEERKGEVGDEVERLRKELRAIDARTKIDDLKRAGKLVPAAEVFARAILESGDTSVITFGGSETPVNQIFLWFMESQPKVIEFSELAAAGENKSEEPEVFTKLGVTSRQVERYRSR